MRRQLLFVVVLLWTLSSCQRGTTPEVYFHSIKEKVRAGDREILWENLSPRSQGKLEAQIEIGMNLIDEVDELRGERKQFGSQKAKQFFIDELAKQGEPRTLINGEVIQSTLSPTGAVLSVKYTGEDGQMRDVAIELSKLNDRWYFEAGAWLEGETNSEIEEEEVSHPAAQEFSESKLSPIIVNLGNTKSFLKVSVALRFDPTLLEFQSHENLIRDILIEVLSSKKASQIISNEQKEELKQELRDKLNQRVSKGKDAILQIFFTEFIIQ